MAREIHDDRPIVEVIDLSDLKPCPPLPGPWPERVTARCVCCGDRVEFFIERRGLDLAEPSAYAIPVEVHATLLAQAASGEDLCGGGLWLCVQSERGIEWFCNECAVTALDFDLPEVERATEAWKVWTQIEVEDRTASAPPHRRGWWKR